MYHEPSGIAYAGAHVDVFLILPVDKCRKCLLKLLLIERKAWGKKATNEVMKKKRVEKAFLFEHYFAQLN